MLKKIMNLVNTTPPQNTYPGKTYILLTYRSHIKKVLPSTYYDSDAGWGCMLRVGQMAIANLLYLHEGVPLKNILSLFWDNSDAPFSIQQLTHVSQKLFAHKKPYEWYNPSEMSFIIKDLVQEYLPYLHVKIFLDNSIFLQQIPTNYQKLLIVVLIRIGLQQPEQIYLPTLDSLMNIKYFFAALGGTPKHANLFVKSANSQIGYLDPHITLKSAKTHEELYQKQGEYLSKLSWLKATKIDSSMALIFRVGKQEIADFWRELQGLKYKHKQRFFIYIDKVRPEIEEGAMIQISDNQ